jgi:hypothetical protein
LFQIDTIIDSPTLRYHCLKFGDTSHIMTTRFQAPLVKKLIQITCFGYLALCVSNAAFGQTPTLDRLKEALVLERQSDLVAAEAIYQSLINDQDWAAAAHLSLGRVQRWQSKHTDAAANYQTVLGHPLATQGMKDEANLGLAQIDALEKRLMPSLERLQAIRSDSAIASQVSKLRAELEATHPTRIGASYGQVHNKGGATDSSWQLRLTHQLDMRQVVAVGYASNSLQQRSAQPDATLDFIKGQWSASWRYQQPLGIGYSVEVIHRQLNLGTDESSLRAHVSGPIAKNWGASASIQQVQAAGSSKTNGSFGLSRKINNNLQLGGTLFAGATNTGTLYSWMLNTTWEQGPWLAQWFVSRSLDTSPVSHALILRQRLSSGPTWRAELKHDRNGNTAFLGLDIPWGKHVASAAVQTSPSATQWTTGFDYAWPNGLEKASAIKP